MAQEARSKPTRPLVEYFWLLKNAMSFYPDVCIDVGAAAGTLAIYRAFPKALQIAVEPLPEHIPALQRALEGTEHEIYNIAVMAEPGSKVIRKAANPASTSLLSKEVAPGETGSIEVRISTLDDVMLAHENADNILLRTDCQSSDLFALMGATSTIAKCQVVLVKTSMFRFWGPQQPDFYDVVHFMKTQGFVVHDILEGAFRPLDRALGQIDVAFVKESGPLRKHMHWSAPKPVRVARAS